MRFGKATDFSICARCCTLSSSDTLPNNSARDSVGSEPNTGDSYACTRELQRITPTHPKGHERMHVALETGAIADATSQRQKTRPRALRLPQARNIRCFIQDCLIHRSMDGRYRTCTHTPPKIPCLSMTNSVQRDPQAEGGHLRSQHGSWFFIKFNGWPCRRSHWCSVLGAHECQCPYCCQLHQSMGNICRR